MTHRDQIHGIIAQNLGRPIASIDDTQTIADLGGDSLDGVQIAMEIEETFALDEHMPNEVIDAGTVGQIVAAVDQMTGAV